MIPSLMNTHMAIAVMCELLRSQKLRKSPKTYQNSIFTEYALTHRRKTVLLLKYKDNLENRVQLHKTCVQVTKSSLDMCCLVYNKTNKTQMFYCYYVYTDSKTFKNE